MNIHADQLFRARLFTINDRPVPYQSIVEHKAIIACIESKDKHAARLAMQSHRKRSRGEIVNSLND